MSDPRFPKEQLPVPLFDGVVLAVRDQAGSIYLSFRDLCQVLGLDYSTQRRRVRTSPTFALTPFHVELAIPTLQIREVDFLILDAVPLWILTIQPARISEEQRGRFRYIQDYLVGAVQAAFAQLTGLPNVPSNQIEDLAMLDRMDQAFQQLNALAERQAAIEDSQQRARLAFRDIQQGLAAISERLEELERQTRQRITPAQRGTIYHMVETWGAAAAARSTTGRGAALHTCWRLINARFGVATYTDLPAGRYDEIIQFIKEQYRTLTGEDLSAGEQRGLEL